MEAGGIEPPSAVAPNRTSTSVVCDLISPGGRCADDLPTGQPILWSHPSGDQRSFGASPFSDAATRITGRIRSDASPNYLGGECEIVIRTYVDSRCLTRPTGDLGLQLGRRTDHVETWSPPYVPYALIVGRGGRLAAAPSFPGMGACLARDRHRDEPARGDAA